MSVHITRTDPAPWQYVHDEGGHGGDFDPATLGWGQNSDGSENQDMRVVACPYPDCGAVSYWPREAFADSVVESVP